MFNSCNSYMADFLFDPEDCRDDVTNRRHFFTREIFGLLFNALQDGEEGLVHVEGDVRWHHFDQIGNKFVVFGDNVISISEGAEHVLQSDDDVESRADAVPAGSDRSRNSDVVHWKLKNGNIDL